MVFLGDLNPSSAALPSWGQNAKILSSLSPKTGLRFLKRVKIHFVALVAPLNLYHGTWYLVGIRAQTVTILPARVAPGTDLFFSVLLFLLPLSRLSLPRRLASNSACVHLPLLRASCTPCEYSLARPSEQTRYTPMFRSFFCMFFITVY